MVRKLLLVAVISMLAATPFIWRLRLADASSHREAPLISQDPLADNTDLYAFVSPDRPDTVTVIANYIPLEEPASGPGFWNFDPNVLYQIYVDNTGDAIPDITFQFNFTTTIANTNTFLVHLGNPGTAIDGTVGGDAQINSLNDPDFNVKQTYTVKAITSRATPFGQSNQVQVLGSNLPVPPANIGPGATPNYEAQLASRSVADLNNGWGKVFAGQRDDPFFIDLAAVFDRLELRPLGLFGDPGGRDSIAGFNTHAIAIQIPIEKLTSTGQRPASATGEDAVIGIWASASRPTMTVLKADGTPPDATGPLVQVSRLGNPLVNELFVPLAGRDRWNASRPADEIRFRQTEVVAPEIPPIANLLYGTNTATGSGVIAKALKPFPTTNRTDLELVLYRGIPVNPVSGPSYTTVVGNPGRAVYADMLRLNTAIRPDAGGSLPNMNTPGVRRLGLLGGDPAGFPNGRRLFDDVTDIFLRAAVGGTPFTSLLFPDFTGAKDPNVAPNNALSDGVDINPEGFLNTFPYVQTPTSGFDTPHAKKLP